MTRLSRVVPRPKTAFLPLAFCLITWLLGLALSIPLGTKAGLYTWSQQINDTTLIALPTPLDGAADLQTAPLLHALKSAFPEADPHILPAEDIQENLSSWTTAWTGTLPNIIILHASETLPSINKLVLQQAPHAIIIPPPAQKSRLWPFINSLKFNAKILAYIISTGALLLIATLLYGHIYTTCRHTTAERQLLLSLGANTQQLSNLFATRVSLMAFFGSIGGNIILIPTLAFISNSLRPLLHLPPYHHLSELFTPHLFLPVSLIEILCLIPCFIAAISWGLTQLFFHINITKTHLSL